MYTLRITTILSAICLSSVLACALPGSLAVFSRTGDTALTGESLIEHQLAHIAASTSE